MPENAAKVFSGLFNVKYLATSDADGTPNIVPVISLNPHGGSKLIFGQLMLQKTFSNLQINPKVGFIAVGSDMKIWRGTGDFAGFRDSGPEMDFLNSLEWIRYNAYTGFKGAGTIEVLSMEPCGKLSQVGLLASQKMMPGAVAMEKAQNEGVVPPTVLEKFMRVKAIKAAAVMGDDGYPRCRVATAVGFPAVDVMRVSFHPGGADTPVTPGKQVAVSVITLDPIAYQIKACVKSSTTNRFIADISRAYSASPPLAGEDLSAIKITNNAMS